MNKILVIDNYDSFTYNLVHMAKANSDCEITVLRNDEIEMDKLYQYDKFIISPGPGIPRESGRLMEFLNQFSETKPILGICLGHQAITENFGGELRNLSKVYHGVSSTVEKTDSACPILNGLENSFEVGRYHSWIADRARFPEQLMVTSVDDQNEIMSCKHISLPIYGLQFHPESIMTPDGSKMIKNFIEL